jgi:hypothetical protein
MLVVECVYNMLKVLNSVLTGINRVGFLAKPESQKLTDAQTMRF